MNNFHLQWDSNLKAIASLWARDYAWIYADEAYSELLVWYAEALNSYDSEKGDFSTYFNYFKRKAFAKLYEQWHNGNHMAHWELDAAVSVEDRTAKEALHEMLLELDKVHLTDDARQLLDFILTTDLTADAKHKRVGKNTVIVKAHQMLQWTYSRSEEALSCLQKFYGERAFA